MSSALEAGGYTASRAWPRSALRSGASCQGSARAALGGAGGEERAVVGQHQVLVAELADHLAVPATRRQVSAIAAMMGSRSPLRSLGAAP